MTETHANVAGNTGSHAATEAAARKREAALIARIVNGERELFHDLIRPHERGVYVAAFSILQNEAEAEDAAQEAFLKAYRGLSAFRGEARFSTWLFSIAMNEARSRLRSSRSALEESLTPNEEEVEGDYTPAVLSDWRYVPSEQLERAELRRQLQDAIAQLKPEYRAVLILRDVQELNIAETAAALGIAENLVKVRLFRARLAMQKILAPQLLGTPGGWRNWLVKKAGWL